MGGLELVLLLLAVSAGLRILADRLALPYSALLVVGGLILAFTPNLPRVELSPDVLFLIFVPPLLYWGAVSLPLGLTARLRRTQRPAPAPKTQARGTAPGRATATGMNPRQVEFQRRIDAAMAKARAEREEDARRASSGE